MKNKTKYRKSPQDIGKNWKYVCAHDYITMKI